MVEVSMIPINSKVYLSKQAKPMIILRMAD